MASVGGTPQKFGGYSTFLTARLVDLVDVALALALAAVVEVVFGFVAVVEALALGLVPAELDFDLIMGVGFTLAFDRAAVDVDLVPDLEAVVRAVFVALEAVDLDLLATVVFDTLVLRLDSMLGASGIEFCGGWSRLAMTGISSDFSS
jgi:hypothetical protein